MVKKIKLGMVGGGNDAFIGAVHRIASRIDFRRAPSTSFRLCSKIERR